MSTLQLRTFFAVCVLLYFCALFFAQEIVSFGKFVNSEQTRQKIFSQWKPMHSAASQYLRAAMTEPEVVRDEKRDVDFVKAADASELPKSDEEKDGDDKAVSEEQDVPSPATHHVDASAAPASYEPSLNPPQEAPPTAHTQDQEHREPEHEKAAETHKHGERAPPPISVTPEDHQDAEDDSGAAATMDENSSQVPLDAENRHREPDYLSREPQQKDEVERAHHPVATDLHRAANEPTLHEKTDRDADDSTITHANNVNPSNNPPIISRNERESTVVRTAEAESQNAPTDTAAAAAAIPSLAHTDEPAHSPPSAPPSKPIELDDVSAAPVPVRGDEGAADAMKESEKQVTASATPATEARANEEENGGHETQDGFHHYHLDEAR
uniref:Uncharacterized protein n=1 Tax=Globisporangium ultimum (strain ATCC 200006 / CBS 805.95 / DAOM BR144) TaxID=431595 RepID=K3XC25_GLOUD